MNASLPDPNALKTLPEALTPLRERILANLVMIAQIPSPTGGEGPRVRFLLDRFAEAGMTDASADEAGNAVGRLRGAAGRRTILLVSHLDTIVSALEPHEVRVEADRVLAPAVADNALGAAVVSLMPVVLERLGIQLQSDLLLVGSTRSVGRGNHAGLRFFLDHPPQKIDAGICVEGIRLGRLNFFSVGTARADVTCTVRETNETSGNYGSKNAIVALNDIVGRILGIATPSQPYTMIRLGKLRAGVDYDVEPDQAKLGLEIISHSDEMIEQICSQIRDIVGEASAQHAVDAALDVFFSTKAGGVPFSHPLVKAVLDVMEQLGIEPDQSHAPSELSELIARGIPSVTLGITYGKRGSQQEPDHVHIGPLLTGVAQLVGAVLAIDSGVCDAS